MKGVMQLAAILGFLSIALILSASAASAAYSPYGYENTYYQKTSYDYDGYEYVKKEVRSDPWGKTTTYVKNEDYARAPYYGRYDNRVADYWQYGPSQRPAYLGSYWDDSYRRNVQGSQYYDYYYHPKYYYNGNYYNWHGEEPRCNTVRYCSW